MKTALIVTMLVVSGVCASAQNLLISGGNYFDTASGTMKQNKGILVISGKITNLSASNPSGDIRVISLADNDYILPGLFDLHAHYRVSYNGISHDDTVAMPKLFLAAGITSTFTAGEIEPVKMRDLRESIDRGERPGPRIMNSGPYFGESDPDWNPDFTVQDIYDRADHWAELGVAGFKTKNITAVHLKALIERAHFHGLTVTGHLNSGHGNSVNPQEAILMGIDRVEHFLGGRLLSDSAHAYQSLQHLDPDDPGLQEIIDLFVSRKVYFDATVGTYGAIGKFDGPEWDSWIDERQFLTPLTRRILEEKGNDNGLMYELSRGIYPAKRGVVKRYFQAGGLLTTGSDRPFLIDNLLGDVLLGGLFIHREMEVMVNSGIPEAEVLKIATINGARAMGKSDYLGSIEVGKWADLLIIKGNPLEDIRATRTVHTTIKGGVTHQSDELRAQCQGKLGPVDEESWAQN